MGALFLLGFLSVALFYWTANRRFHNPGGRKFFILFPAFLIVSMGLSLHNGLAVVEGWLGIKTAFKRTPKFNIIRKRDPWINNVYVNSKVSFITLLEGVLCAGFVFAVVKGIQMEDTTLIVFHSMMALGFGTVCLLSLKPWANA